MSKFKKLFLPVVALLATFILVACSQTQKTDLQNFADGQYDNRTTMHYQGDKMVKQETKNIVLYEAMGIEDADQAKQMVESTYGNIYKDLKGFTYKVDYQKDRFVETISIDYSKIDFDQAANTLGAAKTEDGKGISHETLLETFTRMGYKEIKDGKFQELSK